MVLYEHDKNTDVAFSSPMMVYSAEMYIYFRTSIVGKV